MLPLRLAARFLRKSPVQSALIVLGIGVGIATMVFVGSIIQSLQANLIDQTIGTGPHITISAFKLGDPVVYSQRMKRLLATDTRVRPDAVAAVRTISALWTNGTDSAPLNVIGARVEGLNGIYKLDKKLVSGTESLGPGEIVLGKDFAEKWGMKIGDTITLIFKGSASGNFKVTGIYDLGTAAFNERNAFVNETVPQTLLGWRSDQYSAIYVQVREPFRAGVTALQWKTQLGNVDVVDWQAQNANLLSALQSQSLSSYMIQAFVLVAVALGIASTLAISAAQKTRQIGILKAMGLSDRRAGLVFFYEALVLGGLGSALGVALALLFVWGFSFAPTPFSVVARPAYVVLSALIGVGVALLSSVVPIRRTSRLDPIEVIQSA